MNIRYIQSNIKQIPQDNLVKFLYDLILQEVQDIDNYIEGNRYYKGDRVYLQENGKHQIFQCIVDNSSLTFINDEWMYIMEVFEGNVNNYYNLKIKEEVHIIDETTKNGIYTNLEIKSSQYSVALYCGKKRYSANYDFSLNGNQILFTKPFNIGDRLILEVREIVGTVPVVGIVLYDLNGYPYNVYISNVGIIKVEEYININENDIKYGELATGDRTYTLLVDGGSKPYELKAYRNIETYITGTDDKTYKVVATENNFTLVESDRGDCFSDTKVILGLDKKFYTLSLENDIVVANEYIDEELEVSNYDLGVKVITNNFKNRLICIDNGQVSLLPYIDNGGYHNINFIDRITGEIIRLTINDDNELELYDYIDIEGYSGTRLLDYFYFFDNEWTYNRMYVENGNLLFETCEPEVIPDSRGVNLLKKDGEMMKLRIPNVGEGIHIVKCISFVNMGTFESPIEGFVVMIDNKTKLVTVNKETNGFEIIDTNLPFRTNHHYVMSSDNKIYKLSIDGESVSFIEGIDDDYDIECVVTGAFIKSNEMITRFDIVDGECVFNPISTFVHRIKSENDEVFVMDVIGEPYKEMLCFTDINNVEFETEVGYGNLYLKDNNENYYMMNFDRLGNINVNYVDKIEDVDYEITSLIESSQGLYKIILENQNIRLEKLFDNMYEHVLSYGNMVKKSFEIQSSDGIWYSLAANGLGEIVLNKQDTVVDVTGLLLRSDDGYNYGLGVIDNRFVTYRSYVANPNVKEKLFVKDSVNDDNYELFMTGDRLCSNTINNSVDNTSIIMYDAYQNEYKIEIINNVLTVTSL